MHGKSFGIRGDSKQSEPAGALNPTYREERDKMGKRHHDRTGKNHKRDNYEMTQEGLDEYIRVSRPSVMVVIISLVLALVAVIVWGFVGTLPVTETITGVVVDSSKYGEIDPESLEAFREGEGFAQAATSKDEKEESPDVDPSTEPDAGELDEDIVVFCFLDASRYNGQAIADFGSEAVLKMPDQTTYKGTVESRFLAPISMEDAKLILFDNDWVLDQCVKQAYSWWLVIRPEEDISKYAFTLTNVTILTEEVAPIQFLMK